jgi:glyoxylase-like metal-dependent hydrolase (beta-lactamase superfamily II)
MHPAMILETFAVGPLGCNCTILGDEATKDAIVIDPGGDEARILATLAKHGLTARALIHTHTHIDHVGATHAVQQSTHAAARIHEGDLFLYEMLPVQGRMIGIRPPPSAELDRFLVDGEVVQAGPIALEVIHTPGHTPGSVCFHCQSSDGRSLLFAGDTLFAGSIGRTDLWGGDHDQILRSIKRRLLTLAPETVVITGHDRATTIDREAKTNPFLT